MTLVWRYAVRSEVGLVRSGNEDSAYAGQHLIAVADGMGGHAAGEVASAATIAALTRLDESLRPGWDALESMRRAVRSANATLRDIVAADSELHGMGTTVTAAMLDESRLVLVHVGDSRAYRLRDGRIEQLTHDHTYVQQLVDDGRLHPDETSTHPQRSVITRALDGRDDLDIDVVVERALPGDRYLVCSDGLSGVVRDETLQQALAAGTPDDAVDALMALALRAGGPDNITCIVADVAEVTDVVAAPGQVVGAADDSRVVQRSRPPSGAAAVPVPAEPAPREMPAAAVAALGGGAETGHASDPGESDRDDDPHSRARALRRRRTAAVMVGVLVLLGIGGAAGWAVVRSQYYVGVSADQVAIFQGVQGSVLGIDLSTVHATSGLDVASLPEFQQQEVRDGIHADGLEDAEAIIDRLRDNSVDVPAPECASIPTVGPSATTAPRAPTLPSPPPTPAASCRPEPIPNAPPSPTITPIPPS